MGNGDLKSVLFRGIERISGNKPAYFVYFFHSNYATTNYNALMQYFDVTK